MTFINELEIRRRGRLSTVSRRKASFDGYGCHSVDLALDESSSS
jgi:hypothetical protein